MKAQLGSADDADRKSAHCFCPAVPGASGEITYTQSHKKHPATKDPNGVRSLVTPGTSIFQGGQQFLSGPRHVGQMKG